MHGTYRARGGAGCGRLTGHMAVCERPGLRAVLWTEARAVDRGSTVDRGRDREGAHDDDVVRVGGSPE